MSRLKQVQLKQVKPDPWYKEGLKFKCTECGKCCTGFPGCVWLTDDDIDRMLAHLKISFEKFQENYTQEIDGRLSLKEDSENYDCIFFENNRCKIYKARPQQCQTYPYWPRVLESKENWDLEGEFCEGINHPDASVASFEDIQNINNASQNLEL